VGVAVGVGVTVGVGVGVGVGHTYGPRRRKNGSPGTPPS
jgi:hypothetical protein